MLKIDDNLRQFSLKEQAQYIMMNFNFNKVHHYMSQAGWAWIKADCPQGGVPDIRELKEEASTLLNALVESDNIGYESGGFRASKKDGKLKLEFISKNKEVVEEVICLGT